MHGFESQFFASLFGKDGLRQCIDKEYVEARIPNIFQKQSRVGGSGGGGVVGGGKERVKPLWSVPYGDYGLTNN